MKKTTKNSEFWREARPWMVIAGVGSFVYSLLRFDDIALAPVGMLIGVVCAFVVVRYHYSRKGRTDG